MMASAAKRKVQDDDGKRLIEAAVISGPLAEQVIGVMAEAARMAGTAEGAPAEEPTPAPSPVGRGEEGRPRSDFEAAAHVERLPQMVFLSKLKLCDGNVRRGTKGDLDQLAADIAAHGLLQNLTGVLDADGTLRIIAGGRRLRAMQQLVKRKIWDGDALVPVMVLEAGDVAKEAGLAENFQRLALSPADEARAFAEVVAGGASDEDVARRFGVTVRHVRQRLRLAGLAPVVLDALAKGKITLDVAQAFASVPDAERQAKVFKEASSWDLGSADSIRRKMASVGFSGDDRVARFVGREAYLAAGGRITADLFAEAQTETWVDGEQLKQLAREKLAEAAAAFQGRHGFARVFPMLWINERPDDVSGLEIAGYHEDWVQRPGEERARLIVGLGIGRDGVPAVEGAAWWAGGPVVDGLRQAQPERSAAAEDDEDVERPEVIGGGAPTSPTVAAEPEGKALSGALLDALAMRRRDGLALALMQPENAGEAQALLVFLALEAVLNLGSAYDRGSSIASAYSDRAEPVTVNPLPWAGDDLDTALQKAVFGALDWSWRDGRSVVARWEAFRLAAEQTVEIEVDGTVCAYDALGRYQAAAAGLSLKAWGENNNRQVPKLHPVVAQVVGADDALRPVWRPTAANYFDRAGKARCMAFLEEVFGAADGPEPWAKLKKAELSARCERLAAGDATDVCALLEAKADSSIVSRIVGRAKSWLPVEICWGAARG